MIDVKVANFLRYESFTYDGIGNEDVEEAVAVEIELKESRYRVAWRNYELCVFVGAGDIHTVSQKAECMHDNIL